MSVQSSVVAPPQLTPMEKKHRRGYWVAVRRRLSRDPVAITCACILVVIVLAAIFAPLIAPADPYKTSVARRLLPIGSSGHLLGTDELGRDMLSRLIYGGRVSLLMGLLPVVVATLVGGFLGLIAGFSGGRINMITMRIVDVFRVSFGAARCRHDGCDGAGLVELSDRPMHCVHAVNHPHC